MRIIKKFNETLKDYDLNRNTDLMLKRYGWELRTDVIDSNMPPEIMNEILKIIKKNFKSIPIIGDMPYFLFSNLYGIVETIRKEDEDSVIFIVAPPGTGKSTLSLICAKFVDPTFNNTRTLFTKKELQDFLTKASKIHNQMQRDLAKGKEVENPLSGKSIILDEGLYLLFSGDAITKEGKLIEKLFSIIRALNLLIFVNVTNLRKINKGIREDRLFAIIRVPQKGSLTFYSKKKISKIEFRPGSITYPKANFYDTFGKIDPKSKFWKEYRVKKGQFLYNATQQEDKND